jgi:2-keto-3-deoxygluconate permease
MTGIVCILPIGYRAAASSTARDAAGTPQAIAQADRSYATVATIQVAVSMIATAVLTLILKAWAFRHWRPTLWPESAAEVRARLDDSLFG